MHVGNCKCGWGFAFLNSDSGLLKITNTKAGYNDDLIPLQCKQWWWESEGLLKQQWFRITSDLRQIVLNTTLNDTRHNHRALLVVLFPLCNRSICASLLNHYFSWWWYICAIVCMTQGTDRAFRGVAPRADRHPRRWGADKRLVCTNPVGPLSMATYPDQHHLLYLFATWNPKALACLHFRQWG